MIGLLFGSQNGLDVSIYDAVEVACTAAGDDGVELNESVVEKQKDLCKLKNSGLSVVCMLPRHSLLSVAYPDMCGSSI